MLPSLRVNEIFYSIQGEGFRAGEASIFIRLSGCDLTCGFCDTEFESGKDMTLQEMLDTIAQYEPCRAIVWTGGEPALQLTDEIVFFFAQQGYFQCVETSGGHRVPKHLDVVSVSPKVAEHVLAKNFPDGVTELKYVMHKGKMSVPVPSVKAQYYFLQPQNDGHRINYENLEHCLKLILENPKWRLSMQSHKIWKVL